MLPRNGWQFAGIVVFVLALIAAAFLWLFTNCHPFSLLACQRGVPCPNPERICQRNHDIALWLVLGGGTFAATLVMLGSFVAKARNEPRW